MYELTDVETWYSTELREEEMTDEDVNDAFVQFKLVADRQLVFDNDNLEFPDGVYIENYNPDSTLAFTLKANKGWYDATEKTYRVEGNVILRNFEKDEQLNTEELFWKPGPGDEAIYTDKFVTVKTQNEIIYGEGLRASQDFRKYKILKPKGTLNIENN